MSIHAPYFINFASPEPEKAENSVNYILSSLKILKCFGGERCVFHAGAQGKDTREEAFARTKYKFARTLERIAEEPDFADLIVCPETMGKQAQIGTVEEVIELCKMGENVYPCVDFGHINALYGGILKGAADFETIVKKLFDGMFTGKYRRHADFFSRMSEWNAFSVTFSGSSHVGLAGNASFSEDAADFMKIFSSVQPGTSSVSSMLPSYAFFAASLPFGDVSAYIDAYQQFADTGNGAVKLLSARKELAGRSGVSPVEWASALSIQEAGVVAFYAGKNLEQVVLLKVGKEDVPLIFKGTDVTGLKGYEPKVHSYAYAGFAASLFGPMFNVGDESCFTYMDGWIISGSAVGVGEYVSGRALENTLKGYMADAGLEDRLSAANRCFVSYFSLSENPEALGGIFSKRYAESMARSLEGITYEPVTMSVGKEKSSLEICLDLDRVTVRKSKPPVFERDTVIVVSRGPFRVKNSGTGRMNLFYQQDNMYLCLQEENGKGIWAAPFSSPIAGRAGTIDYFANGKLQILFASGSKLHLIDRLGRFVSPFPIDLGKNILLGPDIYDFNGSRRYNVMVLHDDNTIDMYNLQGRKPLQWKGITAQETIKGLPEALKAGGRTYWVVRTSMQTLIYPFYGGEPLTKGTGDRMIRPDSKVVPVSGNTVKAVCYDGKEHDFRL